MDRARDLPHHADVAQIMSVAAVVVAIITAVMSFMTFRTAFAAGWSMSSSLIR